MMKLKTLRLLLAMPVLAFSVAGCVGSDDEVDSRRQYSRYTPILMSRSQLENSIKAVADKPITNTTKVFLIGNRIYMTEPYKGVYIVDNTDPRNPTQLGYISVPGLNDAVVKENVLICDNATDLVGIDVSSPTQPEVLWRRRNVLPGAPSPDGLPSRPIKAEPGSVVIEWVLN